MLFKNSIHSNTVLKNMRYFLLVSIFCQFITTAIVRRHCILLYYINLVILITCYVVDLDELANTK